MSLISLIPNLLCPPFSKTFHLSILSVGSDPLCCYFCKGSVLVCWYMHVCLSRCVPAAAGASLLVFFFYSTEFWAWLCDSRLDSWSRGGQRREKECKGEEWATDGEKVGRTPVSIESLFRVFEVRGWGFREKQDYSESKPLNNPGVLAAARKPSRANGCGFAVLSLLLAPRRVRDSCQHCT